MSLACLSKVSVAKLRGVDKHEEICAVNDDGQSEIQKYVCTVCLEQNVHII